MRPSDMIITAVQNYFNSRAEKTDGYLLEFDDVYITSFYYILGGWKGMASTTVVDGMYYEVTFDKEKNRIYLDAYKKFENVCITDLDRLTVP